MITTTQTAAWEFGGFLAGRSPLFACTALGAVAVLGAGFIYISYRAALVELSPMRRGVLVALRASILIALLLILAGPTHNKRRYEEVRRKPLAILIDRSGSMITPDNRKRRRLDDALRRWRTMEPAAKRNFSELHNFAFAETMQSVDASDAPGKVDAAQTKLYSAFHQVFASAPADGWGAVVVLTDGLDTAGGSAEAEASSVAQEAVAAGTPLYFVPGRNRYAGGAYFGLREFGVPDQAPPHSTFRLDAAFDSYEAKARDLEVSVIVNGVAQKSSVLHLEAGRRLTSWATEIQADAPGELDIRLKAGTESARAIVRVASPASNRFLYYQGALDWNYRFLSDILKRDSTFTITPVFNFPNPNAALPPGALARLPLTDSELAQFDIVLLANIVASQLNAAQQTALDHWVRDGGILVFLTPDDDSTSGFAGSELEKMLPVVFAPPQPRAEEEFRPLDRLRFRANFSSSKVTVLNPYAWESNPHVKEIFNMKGKSAEAVVIQPLFSAYAHVARAKPGAEVLARHPVDLAPNGGEHAILLAMQRYGRGRSVVLTTDSLWRWKLNQPTTERGAETFWENLFSWLLRDRQRGLTFENPPLHVALGQDIPLRILGGGTEKLKVSAGAGSHIAQLPEASADGTARIFHFQPDAAGTWELTASDAEGRSARRWVSVAAGVRTGEYSGLPPDENLLRMLATRTGGEVLENSPPADWQSPQRTEPILLGEEKTSLWDQGRFLSILLGLYGAEMLLRRRWKML